MLILSVDDIAAAQDQSNSLIYILENAIGQRGTAMTGIVVILSIYACAVASMATATRLLFSLSRDQVLPFSRFLSRVNKRRQTPQVATIVVWLLSCVAILTFRRIEIITSVGTVAAYLGYSGIMLGTLITTRESEPVEGFNLGRMKTPVRGAALVWTLLIVTALALPETEVPGMNIKHLPALSALVAILVGTGLYFGLVRKKIKRGIAGPPKEGN